MTEDNEDGDFDAVEFTEYAVLGPAQSKGGPDNRYPGRAVCGLLLVTV
jgi:hypothetical protein